MKPFNVEEATKSAFQRMDVLLSTQICHSDFNKSAAALWKNSPSMTLYSFT